MASSDRSHLCLLPQYGMVWPIAFVLLSEVNFQRGDKGRQATGIRLWFVLIYNSTEKRGYSHTNYQMGNTIPGRPYFEHHLPHDKAQVDDCCSVYTVTRMDPVTTDRAQKFRVVPMGAGDVNEAHIRRYMSTQSNQDRRSDDAPATMAHLPAHTLVYVFPSTRHEKLTGRILVFREYSSQISGRIYLLLPRGNNLAEDQAALRTWNGLRDHLEKSPEIVVQYGLLVELEILQPCVVCQDVEPNVRFMTLRGEGCGHKTHCVDCIKTLVQSKNAVKCNVCHHEYSPNMVSYFKFLELDPRRVVIVPRFDSITDPRPLPEDLRTLLPNDLPADADVRREAQRLGLGTDRRILDALCLAHQRRVTIAPIVKEIFRSARGSEASKMSSVTLGDQSLSDWDVLIFDSLYVDVYTCLVQGSLPWKASIQVHRRPKLCPSTLG